MAYTELEISPIGGCVFSVNLIGDYDTFDQHLGTVTVGEVDDDGQWVGDDDEVEAVVRERFGHRIPDGLPVVGWP